MKTHSQTPVWNSFSCSKVVLSKTGILLVRPSECHLYLEQVSPWWLVTSSLSSSQGGGRVVYPASDLSLRTLADQGFIPQKSGIYSSNFFFHWSTHCSRVLASQKSLSNGGCILELNDDRSSLRKWETDWNKCAHVQTNNSLKHCPSPSVPQWIPLNPYSTSLLASFQTLPVAHPFSRGLQVPHTPSH